MFSLTRASGNSMLLLTRAGGKSIALATCSIFTEQKAQFGKAGKVEFHSFLWAHKSTDLYIIQHCYKFSSSFFRYKIWPLKSCDTVPLNLADLCSQRNKQNSCPAASPKECLLLCRGEVGGTSTALATLPCRQEQVCWYGKKCGKCLQACKDRQVGGGDLSSGHPAPFLLPKVHFG